jgi:DNA repair exonuclease SbcCD nuclease subunit
MRLLLLGDLHCNNWSNFSTVLPSGMNSRLADCLAIIDQVKEAVKSKRCDAVVFIGDLYESRTRIENDVAFHVQRRMRTLTASTKVYLVRGNHDTFDDAGKVDSLEGLRDSCLVLSDGLFCTPAGDHPFMLYFVPWQAQPKDIFDDEMRRELSQPCAMFMHQSVTEGTIGPTDRQVHASLDLADLPLDQCTRIFAGDYHKHQTLADGKFMYVGSPLQLNFGEAGQDKYLVVYDTITDEIELVPTNAPRFYEYACFAQFTDAFEYNKFDPTKDFVKVHYTQAEQSEIEGWSSRIKHIEFVFVPPQQLEERCDRSVVNDDHRLIEEYVNQKAAKLSAEERESLIIEGLELLTGV